MIVTAVIVPRMVLPGVVIRRLLRAWRGCICDVTTTNHLAKVFRRQSPVLLERQEVIFYANVDINYTHLIPVRTLD
jgi:hypothetical protein